MAVEKTGEKYRCNVCGAVFLIVLALGISVIAPLCPAQTLDNPDELTFSGTVISVDIDKSTLTVEEAVTMVFPISPDTRLTSDIYDIELSGVEVGDYVSVGYYGGEEGPSKTLTIAVEYPKKGEME